MAADYIQEAAAMTFLSCLTIGAAFLIAVGLLVLAGVMLGWVIPALIERRRAERRGPPPSTG
ncbi:MAG: hypothetical protein ABR576_10520 [Thermoanaerobaculia bacterium]